jgi:hypothetical protein
MHVVHGIANRQAFPLGGLKLKNPNVWPNANNTNNTDAIR